MRISKEQLEREFENTAELFGKSTIVRTQEEDNTLTHHLGAWELDHSPCYGGYVIYEVGCENGAMTCPAGEHRRSAKEMSAFLHSLRTLFYSGAFTPNK